VHGLHLRPRRGFDADDGANAVAVGLRADRADGQPVVPVAAVVFQQPRGPLVVDEQNVEIAIAIVVSIGGAPANLRHVERGAKRRADAFEASLAQIAEHERDLLVQHLRLHPRNLLLDVSVHREDVWLPVQVVVEEEDAEGERQ